MKILVTNDDGIYAQGIRELIEELSLLGEVYVVAPNQEKSACGHGITVHTPIRVNEITIKGAKRAWAIDGTPADCVKLGVKELMETKPDLLVSGINSGANLGTDVLYSGTVSGAVEGILLGVPSMAISLDSHDSEDFGFSRIIAKKMCGEILKNDIPKDILLNVNIPNLKKEEIKGIKVTKLGVRKYQQSFDHRKDPRGRDYYWLAGNPVAVDMSDSDLDVVAIVNKYVTVTPIHYDLTNYKLVDYLKEWKL